MSARSGDDPEGVWIGTKGFAAAARMTERAARKALARCVAGKAWRGAALVVRAVRGRGGSGGTAHEIAVASLPPELRARVAAASAGREVVPAGRAKLGDLIPAASRLAGEKPAPAPRSYAELRLTAVTAVLAAGPKHSPARAACVAKLAATLRYPTGKKAGKPLGEGTIREWVAEYEKRGLASIMRKQNRNRGKRRFIAWEAWDRALTAAGVTEDRQRQIAAHLDKRVRGYWTAGAASPRNIQFDMVPECRELLEAAGVALDGPAMAALCRMPEHYIDAPERRRARIAHIRKADAGQWAARFVPRVRRHRDGLRPMEMVAADVRHSDILYQRQDGTLATAKTVAFLDLATNRLFARSFLLPQGKMIRREHVVMALGDMMPHTNWGMPRCLYLDNGSEFRVGEAAEDLARLADLARRVGAAFDVRDAEELAGLPGVINSEAYNPQSKVIESIFSVFTRSIEPHYPGFIGGNRTAKKTENQGKAPRPMPGNEAEIHTAYAEMVRFYNAVPQSRRSAIGERSPDDAFAAFVADGWRAVILDPREFALAFGPDEWRMVQPGGELHIRNRALRHDTLTAMVGDRVRVRVPILDETRVVVLGDNGEPLCVATEAERYGMRDLAGAAESKRRRRAAADAANAAAAGAAKVDLPKARRRALAALPAPVAPPPLAVASIHPVLRDAAAEPAPAVQRPAGEPQSAALAEMLKRQERRRVA